LTSVNITAVACGAGFTFDAQHGCVLTGPGAIQSFNVVVLDSVTVRVSWADPIDHVDMIDTYT
jgi:hypothetical protein